MMTVVLLHCSCLACER